MSSELKYEVTVAPGLNSHVAQPAKGNLACVYSGNGQRIEEPRCTDIDHGYGALFLIDNQ
jgi:hypothetical protein